jgi:hypothetical protein
LVEKVAQTLSRRHNGIDWDGQSEAERSLWRDDATAALAAVWHDVLAHETTLRAKIAGDVIEGYTCAASEPNHMRGCDPNVCNLFRRLARQIAAAGS